MGMLSPHTRVHPRHTDARNRAEHTRIAANYAPSAREVFALRNAQRVAALAEQ